MKDLNTLNPILHAPLRLSIMSFLMTVSSAEFGSIQEKTKSTAGNLSVQLQKLKDAEYILIKKSYKNNYPNTNCEITAKGKIAFEDYVQTIKNYLNI